MKKIILLIFFLSIFIFGSCIQDECRRDDNCFFEKAVSLDNAYYCSSIKNPSIKRSCIIQVAINSQDLKMCSSINSSYCIDAIAEKNSDPGICKTIEDVKWHDTCHLNIAVNTSNSELCKSMLSDDNRDGCYMVMARQLEQTRLCYFILDIEERDLCIIRRAISSKNSNDCYNIKDPLTKAICYHKTAVLTGKEKICDNIQLINMRADCKANIAKNK